MKGKISKIKNTKGELALPVTTVEAIYMEDGITKLSDEMKDVLKYEEFDNEDIVAEIPSVKEEINGIKKNISDINSSLDNNTNEINNLKTHITGGNAMQEHSHINKTVLDKFSEVDNKLLFNGKPIESSNSGVNSGGSINTDFDTEISLPFTALSNAEVQLTFSPNEIVTYDLEVGDLNTVDGWTVTTKDKKLSAQWEVMVLITETGYEILTK
jgi:methionine aminopeptidase